MNIQKKIDEFLPVGSLIRSLPYILVFKTTNYCWFRCPHCCEKSGPDQPRKYISLDVINNYLAQACQDPQFSGNVVFTGGEIMSSYRFGDPKYVPTLLNMCLGANIGTDIKTNAGWARTSFSKQIFDDLASVVHNNPQSKLQISLSLDKFHTNCLENNARVLEQLAGDRLHILVNIASFSDCADMFPEMMKNLRARGVKVEDMMMVNPRTQTAIPVTVLNGSVVVQSRFATLFDGGRAKSLPGAVHTEFPQFKFLHASGEYLMAFDASGRVTLGENSGRKIATPWQAHGNRIWKLDAIKQRLVFNARVEELRARMFGGWRGIHNK